jgi:hypothetical protein
MESDAQVQQEQIIDATSVLSLPIEDADLISVINEKVKNSQDAAKKIKLEERRKLNRAFWKGDQLDMASLDLRYQVPYIDNIIYDDLETRIALAAGRMPDIITTPSSEDTMSIKNAKDLGDFLGFRLTSSMIKRLIKDALRNYHLDFTSAIKVRWDKNKGENGDFVFEVVRANRIGFDDTATIPHDGFTTENCDLIYEWIEEPLAVVLAKFPKAKEKLIAQLGGATSMNSKRMATKLRYQEVWFRWYSPTGEMLQGTAWKYMNLILDKQKNPYYDWGGTTKIAADESGQYQSSKVYQNYFDQPRMPYIVLTYQNLGESVIDDTTPVEQAIPLQKISNKRGAQITELADRVAPRYAFNGNVMTKEEARRVDPKDPSESIWLDAAGPDDDIRKGMMVTQSAPPPPVLYQDQVGLRNRIDSKFSTHGTTRGETQANESGVSKQITREGDLTTADDMSDIVVERTVYEMACWALQMVKMFYDKPHMVRFTGKDGEVLNREIHQDLVEDGLIAEVKASSVDKQTRRADAMSLVQAKSIDPQTLFEDLDVDNPKERTRRVIAFQNGANDGYAAYMKEVSGDGEEGAGQGEQLMTAEQATQDLQAVAAGQPVEPQGVPGDDYVQVFEEFISGPSFSGLPPEAQTAVKDYIVKLQQIVDQKAGGNGQQQAQAPGQGQPAQPQAAPPVQNQPAAV